MFLRKISVLLIIIVTSTILCAQPASVAIELPEILPASPEPSAFVKAGVGNVNMSTGSASANIPLYTIKLKDYSFPLSLSYSTQGLKADEASTRVGFGWVLNATGIITRIVKGKPDEFAERLNLPANYAVDSDPVYNYYMEASSSTSGNDTEPDEFQFNVNGYSGKFVLDDNHIPRVTATSNVKIEVEILVTPNSTAGYIGIIHLTTPDGVKYTFGEANEKTTDFNIIQYSPYKQVTKTAFFLDKIETPTGESILFNYSSINTRLVTGVTQTLQLPQRINQATCETCIERYSYTTHESRVYYSTKYLTGITTSNGLTINLSYELRPDLSYDNRLKSLDVSGIKKYLFEYYDVDGSNTQITGRFFLTKLRDMKMESIADLSLSNNYTFTYDRLAEVPLPISYKQDYLGFYNGSNSNSFIPPGYNSNNGSAMDFSFRNSNADQAKKGTLTAIQYPTGGKEEFLYESNTRATTVKRNTMATYTLEGNGGGSIGTSEPILYTKNLITVPRDQTVTLSAYADDAVLNDQFTADPDHHTVAVWLYEGTTLIASRSVMGYEPTSTTFQLFAGHTYKLQMRVDSYTERGFCSLLYDASDHDIFDIENVPIPGIRLARIKYTDQLSLSTHSKYYTYAILENLGESTGGMYGAVDYESEAITKSFCGQNGSMETDCHLSIYSSSSSNAVYNYSTNGSAIYYKTVIESDDLNFIHGGTEYSFFNNEMGGNHQTLVGSGNIPYLSMGQNPTLSGVVSRVRTFNKDKDIVQEDISDYETMIYMDHTTPSIYVRKRYEPYPSRSDRIDAFDVIKTTYSNYWIRIKSKINILKSNNTTQTRQTTYNYGDPKNILQSAIITKDSKGVELKTEYKYPTDTYLETPDPLYSSIGYDAMRYKNLITPVVEETSYRDGVLLQQKRTIYKDWFNDNKIVMPELIQIRQSPLDNLHNALVFANYDNAGNVLQLQKVDDIPIVYLWDNVHSLPVCEVRNAALDQVAYAGFEDGTQSNAQYGNWQVSNGGVSNSAAFTGLYSFTGTLTKAVEIAAKYTISLWTNSSALVNGQTGLLRRSLQGWNLYEWTLTNPSSITVAGTNMDDVRLSPSTALMTSYNYIPFVGISSVSDPNCNVTYYEYDLDSRLILIRDQDKNILKKFEYKYVGQQ